MPSPFVIHYLVFLICFFTQCIFPATWKGANVVPLFKKKKSSFSLVSNYRPVSLLSNVSNVMEKVVYKKIYKHLGDNNLLTDTNSRL